MKKCSKCFIEKEEGLFSKKSNAKDGLNYCCKTCASDLKKEYRKNNPEHVQLLSKIKRERDKEKIRQRKRLEYLRDKEKINKRNMDAYWANRENRLAHLREFSRKEENKEKARIRSRANKKRKRELVAAKKLVLSDLQKQKARAGNAVATALRSGKLARPQLCEKCLQKKDLQAHHPDYTRKLDVKWLCFHCHCHEHGKMLDVPVS